jgi:hypothetical protein
VKWFNKKASLIGLKGKEKNRQFFYGLRSSISKHLIDIYQTATFEQLVTKAKQGVIYDHMHESGQDKVTVVHPAQMHAAADSITLKDLRTVIDQIPTTDEIVAKTVLACKETLQVNAATTPQPPTPPQPQPSPVDNRQCWYCGQTGHFKRNCPKLRNRGQRRQNNNRNYFDSNNNSSNNQNDSRQQRQSDHMLPYCIPPLQPPLMFPQTPWPMQPADPFFQQQDYMTRFKPPQFYHGATGPGYLQRGQIQQFPDIPQMAPLPALPPPVSTSTSQAQPQGNMQGPASQ